MRSVVIIGAIVCLLAGAFVGSAEAVGYYVVGKEDCRCSSLVQRGVIPDTLNKFQEILAFPGLTAFMERLGSSMHGFVAQFEEAAPVEVGETAPANEEAAAAKEKPADVKKHETEVKKEEVNKTVKTRPETKSKKPKSKKRVKVPSTAM